MLLLPVLAAGELGLATLCYDYFVTWCFHSYRDDCGRLALHWSAELGLTKVCSLLLKATSAAAAALTARVAAASADADQGEQPPELELPNLLEMQVGLVGAVDHWLM